MILTKKNDYMKRHFIIDPVEKTLKYKKIRKELEYEIQKEMGFSQPVLGSCHIYWAVKKRILREKYNIIWRSPSELNPWINFD